MLRRWSLPLYPCLIAQLCPTLCSLMDCIPPGSPVQRISQARILEWAAISSFRGSSQPRNWTSISCVSCIAAGFFAHWATGEALLLFNLLSCVWVFAMPWPAVLQASLSSTTSQWDSQFLGRLMRRPGFLGRKRGSGVLEEETGVWNSQGGGKDKHFSFCTLHSLVLVI